MANYQEFTKPSKEDRRVALESYDALAAVIEKLKEENPEIEIEETEERIKIPISALKLLSKILKVMSEGRPFSLVPLSAEFTTQKAAEFLGCSRPHVVKLLEEGQISYTKVGRHRRILFEDLAAYHKSMKQVQRTAMEDMMKKDEELGLYDS